MSKQSENKTSSPWITYVVWLMFLEENYIISIIINKESEKSCSIKSPKENTKQGQKNTNTDL